MNRKFDAYWINPRGLIIGVPMTHIGYMNTHATEFGMTQKWIQDLHIKFKERMGQEGKAREKIMIKAMEKGWIRVRHTDRRGWIAQTYSMDKRDKDNIWDFVREMLKKRQDGKYADLIVTSVKNPADMITTSFEDALKGELYNESEMEISKKRIDEFVKKYMTDDNIYLTEVVKSMNLKETKLSRVWQHATDPESSFGIVSAYIDIKTTDNESLNKLADVNKERHLNLYKDIHNMGHGSIELKGGYTHQSGLFVKEKSYMIPYIPKEDLFKLMKKYGQEAVIYKNKIEFNVLGKDEKILEILNKSETGLDFNKEKFKEAFSSLVRGPHRGRKFRFAELYEREQASFNRIAYVKRPLDWYLIS